MTSSSPSFSEQEIERYARHLVLPEIGGTGQQKLKQAKVLVIGAGGLGCPLLSYLTAAGVGTIGIIDDDTVSRSNLQRQILFLEEDIGKNKALCAANHLSKQNSCIEIIPFHERLTHENADEIMREFDLIADGCDNFETRYLVAEKAEKFELPLISAAINRFDGYLSTFMPYQNESNPEPTRRYQEIFPPSKSQIQLPNCSEIGVLGVLPGIIGSLQALEVIRTITDFQSKDSLKGKLLLVDALTLRFEKINI